MDLRRCSGVVILRSSTIFILNGSAHERLGVVVFAMILFIEMIVFTGLVEVLESVTLIGFDKLSLTFFVE